jgi:hypothetical protein
MMWAEQHPSAYLIVYADFSTASLYGDQQSNRKSSNIMAHVYGAILCMIYYNLQVTLILPK